MKLTSFLIPALLITPTLFIVYSCSKSNSGDKPTISIESINSPVTRDIGSMVATLKFTSPNGKLSGGSFYSFRTRLNEIPPSSSSGTDTLANAIPGFSSQTRGEMVYTLPFDGYLSYGGPQNDTLVFKFWAVDATGKSSDTISSPQVIIINQ